MSKKSLLLVIIQFTCFTFFAFNGGLFAKNILLIIQITGLIIGLWGVITMKLGNLNIQPEVKKGAVFVTKGPYKTLRNPMYTGLLLFFGASVIYNFSFLRLSILIILTIVLLLKISMEEQFLEHRFEKEYLAYKKKTYRLIPFIY